MFLSSSSSFLRVVRRLNIILFKFSKLLHLGKAKEKTEVFLDPNNLTVDRTMALNVFVISENVEFLAIGLSASGSDWVNIKVIPVADKSTEPDFLSWVGFLTSC